MKNVGSVETEPDFKSSLNPDRLAVDARVCEAGGPAIGSSSWPGSPRPFRYFHGGPA